MVLSCMIKTFFTLSSISILIGLLVPLLLLSRTMGIASTELPSTVLDCVEVVLISQGESLFRVDKEKGFITTAFRLVSPKELRRIAFTERGGEQVQWTNGIYQLTVTLSALDKRQSRIQVNVRVLAFGKSTLPLMRPSAWWPLSSNGTLEKELSAALAEYCGVNNP
jgi:hypothetical protein